MKNQLQRDNNEKRMTREFLLNAEARTIDEAKRTVTMPVASDIPVNRWFGLEVLDMSPRAVDLSRLKNSAALMDAHYGRQIGVVEKAWLEGNRLWVTVRFSKRADAEEVFQDVVDGIVRNVSIGYMIIERKLVEEAKGELDTYKITRWQPYEVSTVPVPADPTVGVGRSLDDPGDTDGGDGDQDTVPAASGDTPASAGRAAQPPAGPAEASAPAQDTETATRTAPPPPVAPTAPPVASVTETPPPNNTRSQENAMNPEEQIKAERERIKEISEMGRSFNFADQAAKAVEDGTTVDAFRKLVLDHQKTETAKVANRGAKIGMSEQEVKQFSFIRVLRMLADPTDPKLREAAAFEVECSRAYAGLIGRDPKGCFVPPDVSLAMGLRTFNQTTGDGSNMIGTNLLADQFVDMLRNRAVCVAAGATMLPGLVGNVAIPRQTGAMTGYWFNSETAGITSASNPTVDQITLSPKTCGAYGDISRSMLKQATPAAEQLVRNDIAGVISLLIDLAGLKGTASGGQPRGITLTSGINSGNWAAANTPTWAEIVAMETAVDVANALIGNFAYVMGAGLRGTCKTTVKADGQGGFLIDPDGKLNGYGVQNSNQMAAGECIFGRFNDLLIGMWGGLDLQVNPYIEALEKAGAVRVTALQDVDIAVRRPKSFTFYDNSAST